MKKAFTKDGWLTPYAMACGYIHKCAVEGIDFIFSRVSCDGEVYEVQGFKRGQRLFENHYTSIKIARIAYKSSVGKLQYRFESNSEVNRNVIL